MSTHIAIDTSTTAAAARSTSGGKSRVGETTGDCAAVCCCCPCAVVHLFILAIYRLPASIWRKKGLLSNKNRKNSSKQVENRRPSAAAGEESRGGDKTTRAENDAVGWDNEMRRHFHGGGFWRNDSRGRDDR